jgi:outer membrane protein TolC
VGSTIQQIGSIAPTLDPVFQDTQSYSHTSTPQSNLVQTETTNWIQSKHNYTESIQQGLETGGQVTLTYNDSYLHENVPSDVLNPSNGTVLALTVRHNLLQGLGVALNTRAITVAKNTIKQDDLTFRTQVIATVSSVLNLYYGLVADDEDVRAKRSAVEVAQRFYSDNQKQVQIGTMAPLDVTTAESQLASTQRDLVVSQTTLAQQENSLKNALSRQGLADPLLREADIIPLDHIVIPEKDTTPPMKALLATAMKNRSDLKSADINVENLKVNALNTQNAVLPSLGSQVSTSQSGVSGASQLYPLSTTGPISGLPTNTPGIRPCPAGVGRPGQLCEFPDPYFVGGIGTSLGQMLRRDFPTNTAATQLGLTLRNRSALSDHNIDQLTIRQTQLQVAKSVNQVAVDVSNQAIALQQARVRYQAAVRNRVLQQELLDAEQKKFRLGASTTYAVVQQQQLLDTAQSTEIASLVAYSNAEVALNQTLGTTLDANNVSIKEASTGQVARQSSLPEKLPEHP